MDGADRRWVTLREFQEATGLPDGAVVWLLSAGALECELVAHPPNHGKEVRVDLASLNTESGVRALYESSRGCGEAESELFQERLASVVSDFMEAIYPQALDLAMTRVTGAIESTAAGTKSHTHDD